MTRLCANLVASTLALEVALHLKELTKAFAASGSAVLAVRADRQAFLRDVRDRAQHEQFKSTVQLFQHLNKSPLFTQWADLLRRPSTLYVKPSFCPSLSVKCEQQRRRSLRAV